MWTPVLIFLLALQGALTCSNGGFKISDNCTCPSYFTGSTCDQIQCINGGYSLEDNKTCICPPGYLGIHCEAVTLSLPKSNEFATERRFYAVIVNLFTSYWGKATYEIVKETLATITTDDGFYTNIVFRESKGSPYLGQADAPKFDTIEYVEKKSFNDLAKPEDTGLYWCYGQPIYEQILTLLKEQGPKAQQNTLTVVTQHPPNDDNEIFQQVRQTAVAFRVKINVIWISDDAYNDCSGAEAQANITQFQSFAESTGGIFAVIKNSVTTTKSLVETVFETHKGPQIVAAGAWDDCSTARTVNLVADPLLQGDYYFVFRGNNAKPTQDTANSCNLQIGSQAISFDGNLRKFISFSNQPSCSVAIQTSSGGCSVQVFTASTPVFAVDSYVSYVEDTNIDTSRYAPTEKSQLYLSVRLTSNLEVSSISSAKYVTSGGTTKNLRFTQRDAAYNWISSETIVCNSSETSYFSLDVVVNNSTDSSTSSRFYPVYCAQIPAVVPDTTLAPSSIITSIGTTVVPTVITSTTNKIQTSVITATNAAPTSQPITTPDPANNCKIFSEPPKRQLSFAYATDVETYTMLTTTISQFVSTSISPFYLFSDVRFDTKDSSKFEEYQTQDNTQDFYSAIQDTNAANKTFAQTDNIASNVIHALETIRNYTDPRPSQNSIVWLFLNRLPDSSKTFDSTYFVINNIKVFTIISQAALSTQTPYLASRSGKLFNQISALTNGHYIVANDTGYVNPEGRYTSTYNEILKTLLNSTGNGDLLFGRNVKFSVPGTLKIGELDLSKFSSDVSVTISVTLASNDQPTASLSSGSALQLLFSGGQKINILDYNRAGSNIYIVNTTTLPAGNVYSVALQYQTNDVSPPDVHVRIWTRSNAQSTYQASKYVDLTGSVLDQPDTVNGAALQISFFDNTTTLSKASISISNCAGKIGTKYDRQQKDIDGLPGNSCSDFFFVPYFCDATNTETCVDGTQNKYDIQISTADFSITRSFLCQNSDTSSTCPKTDLFGNNLCPGNTPFYRGPTGKVVDCSRSGQLKYNITNDAPLPGNYVCDCDDGFSGKSCEVGICSQPNQEPLSLDVNYRTYTVVVAVDSQDGIPILSVPDAASLFGLIGTEEKFVNIWKYQLIVVCNSGQSQARYSGSNLKDFRKSFENEIEIPHISCDSSEKQFDLTSIYQRALQGVGNNVHGIVVVFSEAPKYLNVTLDDFLQVSQQSQQQLFLFTATEKNDEVVPNDISLAAMATGGMFIQSKFNNDDTPRGNKDFINDILANPSAISFMSNKLDNNLIEIYVDQTSWLITWKVGDNLKLDGSILPDDICVSTEIMAICKLDANTHQISGDSTLWSAAIYPVNADSVSPVARIVKSRNEDSATAVATAQAAQTILAVRAPDGYSITTSNSNGNIRIANRVNCSLQYTAYDIFEPYPKGPNFIKVDLTQDGSTDTITRYFAIASSQQIQCQNGGTIVSDYGYCTCPDNFTGPDCSQLVCLNGGIVNAWGNACNCKNAYGRNCENGVSSIWNYFFYY